MRQCLQNVRDLPKSLQYRLLVVSRRFFKGSKRSAPLCLSHAAVEDRLRKSRGNTPDETGRTEQMSRIQRRGTDPARESYGRIKLCSRDANLRAGSVELRFGCLNQDAGGPVLTAG